MSIEKVVRYTADDFALESSSNIDISKKISAMLWQAAQTEADVAGLVEVLKLARRAIEPLTGEQIRLHKLDPDTANKIDNEIARWQS